MRAIIAFIILVVSITGGWTESLGLESKDFTPRIIAAACDTRSAMLCQNLLKDCLKNCKTNDNPTSCRQICLGNFKSCKTSAGCGGS